MWKRGGLILAALVAGSVPVASQEPSTETACIARLRQAVDHLGKVEQQLAGANNNCKADAEDAARHQIDDLKQALAQSKSDLSDRQAEIDRLKAGQSAALREANSTVDELHAKLANADARLKKIDAAADQLVRAALPDVRTGCDERLDVNTVDGVVSLSGRLLKADDAVRRAKDAVRAIPGIDVKSDDLKRLDLCGQAIGDGWFIEIADGGARRIGIDQIDSVYSRLPEGSDDICRAIGAKLDQLTNPDPTQRHAFWVRLSDQRVTTCSFQPPNGPWKLNDRPINLNATQALVVQHSQ